MSQSPIVFLLDTSKYSINTDFYPSRLDAQKIATGRIFDYLNSNFGPIMMGLAQSGGENIGMISSPSLNYSRANKIIQNMAGDGDPCYFTALKKVIMSIKVGNYEKCRIFMFVCSPINLSFTEADIICEMALELGICFDIIVFGINIRGLTVFEYLIDRCGPPSRFFHAASNNVVLSDVILAAELRINKIPLTESEAALLDDEELYEIKKFEENIIMDTYDNSEMVSALLQSLDDHFNRTKELKKRDPEE